MCCWYFSAVQVDLREVTKKNSRDGVRKENNCELDWVIGSYGFVCGLFGQVAHW